MLAVGDLVARLEEGADPAAIADGEGGGAALLRHLAASDRDPAYQRSLRLKVLFDMPAAGGRAGELLGLTWGALFPGRARMEGIYGPARGPLGRAGRWLWRPFDLVRRVARVAWSWVVVRLRGATGRR